MTWKIRRTLRPRGLRGISESQMRGIWALYEGYVKSANALDERVALLSKKGDYGAEFSELKRRAAFEYNGVLLHERYFAALKAGQPALARDSRLTKSLERAFGSFAAWKKQFAAMGRMRGTGWVILYSDARGKSLVNAWISSHEQGHPAGFTPLLVMDVWEHAYMVDWDADGRPEYIEAFLNNVHWAEIERAYQTKR